MSLSFFNGRRRNLLRSMIQRLPLGLGRAEWLWGFSFEISLTLRGDLARLSCIGTG
jgi:hypothetical protein